MKQYSFLEENFFRSGVKKLRRTLDYVPRPKYDKALKIGQDYNGAKYLSSMLGINGKDEIKTLRHRAALKKLKLKKQKRNVTPLTIPSKKQKIKDISPKNSNPIQKQKINDISSFKNNNARSFGLAGAAIPVGLIGGTAMMLQND